MSDHVNVGDYNLEISGDEVLVRDESGAIVETVELDDLDGELTLPDGRTIDLASVFADAGLEAFQTAAGPANDNTGHIDDGSGAFTRFSGNPDAFDGPDSAGTLNGTALAYGPLDDEGAPDETPPVVQLQSSFDWARHDPANSDEFNPGGRHVPPHGNPPLENADEEQEGEDDADPESDDLPPQTMPPTNEQQQPVDDDDEQEEEDDDSSAPPVIEQQQPEDEDQADDSSEEDEQPQPAAVNAAPTGVNLAGASVVENVSGAVIGNLTVVDPDAEDTHSFAVSDDRFEVVNGQLKLKDGVSLDFEAEPSVEIIVTVTDQAGNQLAETFTIGVVDVNEAPTAIHLSNESVSENATGAVIGTLTTSDPDAGESFSYQVSDSRFEVVNGQLQLKSGVSLDHETEPTVAVKVTSTDSAGHAIEQSFTVAVLDVNEGPTVTSTNGTLHNHIVNTSTAYNPVASSAVGTYLSNDSAGIKTPASNLLNGVDASNMTLFAETPVTVTFQKEAAGHRNMIGTYQYDDDGNIIPGTVKFVWLDASSSTEGKLGATMVKDFLGYSQSNTVSLGTMPAGTNIGFFAISNGASDSANKTLIAGAAAGTNSQSAAMDAIASQLSIQVDGNGNGRVYVGDKALNGEVFFTHDKGLNTDFNSGKDIDHFASGTHASLPGQLIIGLEDLKGGGDKDFNDVVFSVGLGTYNVNKIMQNAVQPTVDLSDVDSSTLSQVVITTSGFQAGDLLNVPPSGDFNVTISQAGADFTITIVGKAGNETIDQYEAFANSIFFSTTSKVEGARHISYSATDDGGLTSDVSNASVNVTNSYEVSSSQLDNGKTTLGSGNDVLYINTDKVGPIDMGDGYDTIRLAKQGMSFGHNEAVKLSNVEAIDTTGYGANNVSLSIHDVLNMTDSDNHLTIIGDEGDTVTLTGQGKSQWTVIESNAEFTTYAYSDSNMQAIVEISNQMTTQVS